MALTSATPTLNGTVGPGFTISLKDSKGKKVKTLKAGSYKFVITDKADIHTFHLKQRRVGSSTRRYQRHVQGQEDLTSSSRRASGSSTARHPHSMFGNFKVN